MSFVVSCLVDSFSLCDVEFVGVFLIELCDNMGVDEIYVLNNCCELFVEVLVDLNIVGNIWVFVIVVVFLGVGDICYELNGMMLYFVVLVYMS